jgi:hypothetical protein
MIRLWRFFRMKGLYRIYGLPAARVCGCQIPLRKLQSFRQMPSRKLQGDRQMPSRRLQSFRLPNRFGVAVTHVVTASPVENKVERFPLAGVSARAAFARAVGGRWNPLEGF